MNNHDDMVNPQLDGDDFYWKGNPTGVLLIHGFTATTAEVRLIGEKLHNDGFTTAAPLLPGHGTHPDDLNNATWGMWLIKVKEFYEKLARDCDRIFVIGESMGALLAIELAAQHPETKGLMLFAPAIRVKGLWLSHLLKYFKFALDKKNVDDGLPWKGYNVYPLKAAAELHKLQQHVKKQFSKINQPTLIFTAEQDNHLTPEIMQTILKDIQSNEKCYIHLENSPHVILLADELDRAYDYCYNFIQRHS
ncbi:MAG: alpha/beta fold hydrolase [Chloroflexota bacterium]|nr:alpha/beta fold hydrolase [Chloroflexota bacterium]